MYMRQRASADARARLLLILLAVPALLVGLLAMHVLSGATSQAGTSPHHPVVLVDDASHHEGTGVTAGHDPAESAACGPACGQDHEMLAMACLLALLVAALTLLATAQVYRGAWRLRPIRFLGLFASAPTEPRPPSLTALSISLT